MGRVWSYRSAVPPNFGIVLDDHRTRPACMPAVCIRLFILDVFTKGSGAEIHQEELLPFLQPWNSSLKRASSDYLHTFTAIRDSTTLHAVVSTAIARKQPRWQRQRSGNPLRSTWGSLPDDHSVKVFLQRLRMLHFRGSERACPYL